MRNICQYWNANDYEAANNIAVAFGWELVCTDNNADIGGFTNIIIVGGQNANPHFKGWADAGILENITASDIGMIHIQYHAWDTGNKLWAVASYDTLETMASANYMIGAGLYKGLPYVKNARVTVGSKPPKHPNGSGVTSQLTISMIIDSIMVGAPYYAVGAVLGAGSMLFGENPKIQKFMKLGAVAGIGIGGIISIGDLMKKTGIIESTGIDYAYPVQNPQTGGH